MCLARPKNTSLSKNLFLHGASCDFLKQLDAKHNQWQRLIIVMHLPILLRFYDCSLRSHAYSKSILYDAMLFSDALFSQWLWSTRAIIFA